jgi:hypothetical protein
MLNTLDVNSHGKRHTDFDLTRIIKAQAQGFDEPMTAYLCGVSIKARAGIGGFLATSVKISMVGLVMAT